MIYDVVFAESSPEIVLVITRLCTTYFWILQ